MSAVNDGVPAFPYQRTEVIGGDVYNTSHDGMTLRDYFAAKAMQGMIAAQEVQASAQQIASYAYGYADAMLKAREK